MRTKTSVCFRLKFIQFQAFIMSSFLRKFQEYANKAKNLIKDNAQSSKYSPYFPNLEYQQKELQRKQIFISLIHQTVKNSQSFEQSISNYARDNIQSLLCYLPPHFKFERELFEKTNIVLKRRLKTVRNLRAQNLENSRQLEELINSINNILRLINEFFAEFKSYLEREKVDTAASKAAAEGFLEKNAEKHAAIESHIEYTKSYTENIEKTVLRNISEYLNIVLNEEELNSMFKRQVEEKTTKKSEQNEHVEEEEKSVDFDAFEISEENTDTKDLHEIFEEKRDSELFAGFETKTERVLHKEEKKPDEPEFEEKEKIKKKLEDWKYTSAGTLKSLAQMLNTIKEVLWEGCPLDNFSLLDMMGNKNMLKKSYLKAMIVLHPDKMMHGTKEEKYLAKELVSILGIAKGKEF